jgi:septum formation protein
MKPLVLASKSPRRETLLSTLGWKFRIVDPGVEERHLAGESPEKACRRLAIEKARAVSGRFPGNLVIGADTIVVHQGKILGKPKDAPEAFEMLRSLSGSRHEVMTGVALCHGGLCIDEVEKTLVSFRPLSDEEIAAYVATGEGRDKAGAYAIQGRGALLVSGISGCYFNVVGLPLFRLSLLLERFGVPLSRQWEVSR